ncbi:MAG TPA: hypothetical protein EYQ14_14505 [Gammaproteobacteria bacterium]|nr:hypothetical protein [Gammaproteobacteria bacterium]HIL98503.1 hypothetical protein [Pseudomonadales bacterium]
MKMSGASKQQIGFTIVEMMVGLGLSSIITLGMMQLFVENTRTYHMLSGQSFMQESGRFAIKTLTRSGQMAGYKGCFSKNKEIYKTFLADIPYEFDIATSVRGFEAETTTWLPDIETVLPKTVSNVNSNIYAAGTAGPGNGIDTSKILRGTDIVTFNHIHETKHRLAVDMATSGEVVEVENAGFEFGVDHMAFIHDCEKGTVFRVTGFDGTNKVEHDGTVDADGYTNALTRLAEFNTFETDAFVSAIISETYFIMASQSENQFGNKPMSLWRKIGIEAPQEIVNGIEDLQVRYGIDTDNDNIPNKYVDANEVADFGSVLTLRITVVANSVNDVDGGSSPTHGCGNQYCKPGETTDGLLRRSFTRTVVLKNRG